MIRNEVLDEQGKKFSPSRRPWRIANSISRRDMPRWFILWSAWSGNCIVNPVFPANPNWISAEDDRKT
jgi:hypothetical protein